MVKYIFVIVIVVLALPTFVSAQTQSECYALNDSISRAVPIYAAPSTASEQIDTLDIREYRAVALINTAWVLLYNVDGTLNGWVDASSLSMTDSCTSGWQTKQDNLSAEISTEVQATIQYPRVNLRQEPSANSARVGQAQKGDTLVLVGQAVTAQGTWFLGEQADLGLVWVRSDLVTTDNSATSLMLIDAAYVDAQAVVVDSTPPVSAPPSVPPNTSSVSSSANLSGSWQHVSTLNEHGCNMGGYPIGTQTTINLDISQASDQSTVTITYATGYQFTLYLAWQRDGTIVYVGTYNQGRVQVEMTFNSSTSYWGNEIVTHDSGCVVKSSWVGYKL